MKNKESYCSHHGRPRLSSRTHHTELRFFKCLYLNYHLSQRIHIWNLGTWEGLLRFHIPEFMSEGGARGQNLGHLYYVICIFVKVSQMLISQQSLITKPSYLKLGYLGGPSEIPKEHIPRFMPWGGAWGQNLGHLCNTCMLDAYPLC